jgi:ABC-type multidrug transport system fused ATPase/permease subunit
MNLFVALPAYNSSFKFGAKPGASSIGSIFSAALPLILVFAGLAMFAMLIWGGLTLMTAGGDQNKTKEGYGRITAGAIGFLIIFVSYFVFQILQVAFGIKFLG